MLRKRIMILLLTFVYLFSFQQANVVFASSDPDQSSAVEADGDEHEETKKADAVYLDFSCEQYPDDRFPELRTRAVKWYFKFSKDSRLSVTADKPVRQLYFQFEHPCEWMLTLPDGTVFHRGENGFIHDYVDLGQSVSDFTVDVSQGTVVTGIFGFTEGETPDWVQKWLPPCDTADLLVLPTHADDEFLWFGGALPYYAGELGYNVQVVYLTNHSLQTFREHERLNGLWTVRVRHYPIVCERFIDSWMTKRYEGAIEKFGWENVLAFQVEMLRRFRPKVIIGHDIKGEYGHGTHVLNAETLLKALELTSDPKAYPDSAEKYGVYTVQKCYLHLWEENRITVRWEDMKLSRFDGKSAMRMADEGYACHQSQREFYSDPSAGSYDCRLFGLAYTTVGYDTPQRNDMFEHVNMSAHDQNIEGEQTGSDDTAQQAVSETDKEPVASPSDKENRSFVWDGNPAIIDVVFIGGVAVALLIAMAILICLKRRE